VREEFFLDAIPVEPSHSRQPSPNRRTGRTAVFEPAGKQLDVCSPHDKQAKILVGTPGHELAEILLIRQPGVTRVARQESGQSQLNLERLLLASPCHDDR
jgi:hypothetical protein